MRDFITFCITVSPIQQTGLFITGRRHLKGNKADDKKNENMADEELSGTGRPVRFLCVKEKNENHFLTK